MPDGSAIASTKARVGYEKLILDANERTVRFAVDGMRLDLGGIGKGYAVDKAVEAMQQHGAIAGLVDSGGNIRCFGRPLGKDAWAVGVQDPKAADSDTEATFEGLIPGEYLLVLRLKDVAVATSGDYRRFVTIGGKKVSHIIDINTAAGANKLSSDTIIAKTAVDADALSTAVNVLGAEKGLALIESLSGEAQAKSELPDVECILITTGPDYRVVKSSGADAYIQ
jgi:thiamine biosynthesis lipoprotein